MNSSPSNWSCGLTIGRKEGHARASRIGVVADAKAVDRSHSGHDEIKPPKRNIGAVSVELSLEELAELEKAASKVTVQGARYSEQHQKLVGR